MLIFQHSWVIFETVLFSRPTVSEIKDFDRSGKKSTYDSGFVSLANRRVALFPLDLECYIMWSDGSEIQ